MAGGNSRNHEAAREAAETPPEPESEPKQSRPRASHFVSLQISSGTVLEAVAAMQVAHCQKEPALAQYAIEPVRLHLTVLVLALPTPEAVQQAASTFHAAAKLLLPHHFPDGVCDYDPRPIVAALLRRGADPNLRCDPAMGPGSGFLRATEPRRRPTRRSAPSRSKWAGHTALWQTCALAFYSLHVSTSSEEHLWSPADAWLEAQRHAASSEEREEHAGSNRRRRKRWDTIGVLMFCPAPIHIIFVHKSAYIQLYI